MKVTTAITIDPEVKQYFDDHKELTLSGEANRILRGIYIDNSIEQLPFLEMQKSELAHNLDLLTEKITRLGELEKRAFLEREAKVAEAQRLQDLKRQEAIDLIDKQPLFDRWVDISKNPGTRDRAHEVLKQLVDSGAFKEFRGGTTSKQGLELLLREYDKEVV